MKKKLGLALVIAGVAVFSLASCGKNSPQDITTTDTETSTHTHDLEHHEAKAPSCTEVGWNAYDTCKSCDYTTKKEIAALGHIEVVDEAVAATCTETGLTEGKHCSRCEAVLVAQEEASIIAHTEVVDEAVAATCTETGLTEGKHCSVCENVLVAQEVTEALDHDYVNHEAKEPTCTEVGWDAYQTCSRCDYTTYEEKAIIAHTFVDGKCSECGEYQDFKFSLNEDEKSYTLTKYTGSLKELVLPSTYMGLPVTKLADNLFLYKSVDKAVVGDYVETIGKNAFYYTMYLVMSNSVQSIGEEAFYSVKEIYFKGTMEEYEAIGVDESNKLDKLYVYIYAEDAKDCDNEYWKYDEDGSIVTYNNHNYVDGQCSCGEYEHFKFRVSNGNAILRGFTGSGLHIVIPSTYKGYPVTEIGEKAFYQVYCFDQITLPSTLKKIGAAAFSYTNLKSIDFPAGLEEIGGSAFYYTKITEVVIPNGVKKIGYGAFQYSFVQKINYPASVEDGEGAFYNCTHLIYAVVEDGTTTLPECFFIGDTGFRLILPNTITSVSKSSFIMLKTIGTVYFKGTEEEWNKLSDVYVNAGDGFKQSKVYFLSETMPSACGAYWYMDKDTNEPAIWNTHTYVDGLCSKCGEHEYLTFALIDDGKSYKVTSCKDDVANVVIPEFYKGLPVTEIAMELIYNNSTVTSVTILAKLKTIPYCAVSKCPNLTTIVLPDTVEVLYQYCFYDDEALANLNLPDGLKEIGDYALYKSMLSAKLVVPKSVESIRANSFGSTSFYSKVYADIYYLGTAEEWEKFAGVEVTNLYFYSKEDPNTCDIHWRYVDGEPTVYSEHNYVDNVCTKCGDHSYLIFELSSDGTYYTLDGFKTPQTEVVVPGTHKGLPVHLVLSTDTFYYNKTIETVVIGEGVTEIPKRCFYYDAGLVSVTLPNSLVKIEEGAFAGCSKLEFINMPSKLEYIGKEAFERAFNENYEGEISIVLPNTVKEIGDSAFAYCNITSITLPEGLKTISRMLFYVSQKISSIVIPNSVEEIQEYAFKDMQIDYIVVPKSVKKIGAYAFAYLKGKKVYFEANLEEYAMVDDTASRGSSVYEMFIYDATKSTKEHGNFWYYDEDGKIVEIVNAHSFEDGKCSCGEYENYTFKIYNDEAIFCKINDKTTKAAVVPGTYKGYTVTAIGDYAFADCTYSLTSVTLPSTITKIGDWAFYYCKVLESIELPLGLVSIGSHAFRSSGITNIVIPDTVVSIGEYAFSNTPLESIKLSNKLERLEPCFFYQSSITSVVLPKSLVYIAQNSVYNLSILYFDGTAEEFAKIDYDPYYKGPTVYYYSETTPTEAGNYWHYVDGVPTIYTE